MITDFERWVIYPLRHAFSDLRSFHSQGADVVDIFPMSITD
jgi:hypothetical protein